MPAMPASAGDVQRSPCPIPARTGSPAADRPGGQDVSSVLARISATVGQAPQVLLRDTDAGDEPHVVMPLAGEMPNRGQHNGRYQLFGEIARGGMGAILKGRDSDLGRDLAVKVLLDRHRGQPDLVRRFVEEAQIGGQLQHPGIVPVYELGMLR